MVLAMLSVSYSNDFIKTKTLSIKAPDALFNTASSILQNKVYIDDVEHGLVAKQASEHDIDNWSFDVSLLELING